MNLIFIVGQTAVGKTDWALNWMGRDKKAGLLNADSISIYKELDKGSAKPEFSNYPYSSFYLFNELQAPAVCTAGFFREKALKILNKKLPKEKIYIVGGSGFYIQALEKGMYPLRECSSHSLLVSTNRVNLNQEKREYSNHSVILNSTVTPLKKGISPLYEELKAKDPETAKHISPKDKYRIVRALSLMEKENKTLSQIKREFKEQRLKWPYIKVGLFLEKEELLKRVKDRTDEMLQKGWIEEVETLLNRGLKNWRALNSVGYKQVQLYLEGEIKKEELASSINSATMKLAKKQKTWFKKDKSIKWFHANLDPHKVYQQLFKT